MKAIVVDIIIMESAKLRRIGDICNGLSPLEKGEFISILGRYQPVQQVIMTGIWFCTYVSVSDGVVINKIFYAPGDTEEEAIYHFIECAGLGIIPTYSGLTNEELREKIRSADIFKLTKGLKL
jgi:hypothetical protein